MTWTAPERPDIPYAADERTLREGFLDWQRDTLLVKCAGLTPEQLVLQPVSPSSLSLLGLLRHMSEVERGWFIADWQPDVGKIYCTPENRDAEFTDVEPARADLRGWAHWVAAGGVLLVHDVFPDPADGGRPPYEIYCRALDDGFVERRAIGSLRVLTRP